MTDAAHSVARTTGDLWDVATSTDVDVDWSARRVTLQTDLDEVMDLMPPSVRESLLLDRLAADNTVSAVYDHRSGTVTLTADVLELSGVQTDSLTAGAVSLEGVRLVLANPGGGLPFAGEETGLPVWKDAADNLVADLTVEGLSARDVVVMRNDGPVHVASLSLSDLQGHAEDAEGSPGGAGSIVGFSVAGALLEGVQTRGATVDRLETTNLSAGISEPGESAFLAAGSVSATGASQGNTSLGSASLQQARVDVANTGGGLPFFDATPDTNRQASFTTHAASVEDFAGMGARLEGASASGVSGQISANAAALTARRLAGTGLDTASFDAAAAHANGVHGDLRWGAGLHAGVRADEVGAQGLVGPEGSAAQASALGVSADLSPESAGISSQRIDVSRLQYGDGALDTATVHDASIGVTGAERRLVAGSATARGASHGSGLAAESLDLAGLDLRSNGDTTQVGADLLRASGVQHDGEVRSSAAGSLEATGTRATLGADGASAQLDRVVGTDLAHGAFGTGRAELNGVGLSHAKGATAVDASSFGLAELSTPWMDARSLSGHGGSVSLNGEDMDAALDRVRLEGGSIADRVGVEAATLHGLSASRQADSAQVGVASGSLTNLSDLQTGAAASSASIDGFALKQTQDEVRVELAALDAAGVSSEQGGAGSLSARGARARLAGDATTASLDSASVLGGRVGDGLAVQQADLAGLSADVDGSALRASLASAELSGLRAATATGETQVGSLSAQGAMLNRDGTTGSLSGGLSALDARNVSGRYLPGNGQGHGAEADTAALVRSGAALVDDAQLKGSAMLKAGDGGTVDVAPDTRVDATLGIRDGRVSPEATRVATSNPLGGPLWTTVNGAYVTPEGKAKASVSGWADKDITGMVNEATGVDGNRRLGTVAEMGSGLAGSLGSSGGSGDRSGGGLIERGTAEGSGWVSLTGGTVDAGSLGSATLAERTQAGDNTLHIDVGPDGLGVNSERIALAGASSAAASLGATTAEDVAVAADGTGASTVQASRIRSSDLRFGQ